MNLDRLHDWLSTLSPNGLILARTVGIVVWVSLAVFSIVLLVLTRTRWGQARTLSKCVFLSVFLHLLFIYVAYGTRLIQEFPTQPRDEIIRLTISPSHHPDSEHTAGGTREMQPWDEVLSDPAMQPASPGLDRQLADNATPPTQRFVEPVAPNVGGNGPTDTLTTTEPERPRPEPVGLAESRLTTPGLKATELETPAAKPDAPIGPEAVAPSRAELQRLRADEVVAAPPRPDLPSDPLASPMKNIQQMADAALNNPATARPGNDQLRAATNPDGSPRDITSLPAVTRPTAMARVPRLDANIPLPGLAASAGAGSIPRRLGDGQQLPDLYRSRLAPNRQQVAEQYGGNAQTEASVEAALAWLARVQSSDGRWNAAAYEAGVETRVDGQDRGGAGIDADMGVTGLALLAFLGAGHSHLEGKYQRNVQKGLEFLLANQAANGNYFGNARLFAQMYCHAMALLAVSETYALTGDARLRPAVEKGVVFTIDSQSKTSGGWRYQPGDPGDMSQFGWQVMALKSAQLGGMEIPGTTKSLMIRFANSVTYGNERGLASYRPGERPTPTMTAEALVSRMFMDLHHTPGQIAEATDFIQQELPSAGKANFYYWYYGTLAMFHLQGESWVRWNTAVQTQLLTRQRTDGRLAGSWDPDPVWGTHGGRIFSTAIGAMCLEVYYRYLPVYGRER